MHHLVIMTVVWLCLRCHGRPEHLTSIQTTRAECLRIRRELIHVNHEARAQNWPTWAPVSAMCMVVP